MQSEEAKEKLAKIIQRIQQLRALSASTHSKGEAEATAAAAAKLIAQYHISEAELSGKPSQDQIFTDQNAEQNVIYEAGRMTPWKQNLAFRLSTLNGCYALKYQMRQSKSHRQGSRIRAFGRLGDIELTKYMFDYLVKVIAELGFDYVPAGKGPRGVNPDRESWCLGCVDGFIKKMESEKEAVLRASSSQAMILVSNKENDAKEALFNNNPDLKVGSGVGSKMQIKKDFFGSGYRQGQKLTVNRGLGGS
jgi:hypothetical protein